MSKNERKRFCFIADGEDGELLKSAVMDLWSADSTEQSWAFKPAQEPNGWLVFPRFQTGPDGSSLCFSRKSQRFYQFCEMKPKHSFLFILKQKFFIESKMDVVEIKQ